MITFVSIILCLLYLLNFTFWAIRYDSIVTAKEWQDFCFHIRFIDSRLKLLMPLMRSFESLFHFICQIHKFWHEQWTMSNGTRLRKQYTEIPMQEKWRAIYVKERFYDLTSCLMSEVHSLLCSMFKRITNRFVHYKYKLNIEHRWELC